MNLSLILLQSASESVAEDLRALVHPDRAPAANELVELLPPRSHLPFHVPLGFVSLVAAGGLLVAAGAVQEQVHDRKANVARVKRPGHKRHLHPRPEHAIAAYETSLVPLADEAR